MAEKLAYYTGGLHLFTNYLKEKWNTIKDQGATGTVHELKARTNEKVEIIKEKAVRHINNGVVDENFSHIFRRKTRAEMIRISAAVMGIEFCYAAETAFVTPTLLKIGVEHSQMTLAWCLSPFIGFFLTPVLGSLSDNCMSSLGRRRPFIIMLSIGIILGLILVPNGKAIGIALGDPGSNDSSPNATYDASYDNLTQFDQNSTTMEAPPDDKRYYAPLGVFFTILGIILLDFNSDACQSPSRAYLLDVTIPEDHAVGLSTFTVMAGLGGGFGYTLGAIDWDQTFIGYIFGGHVRAVFTLVTFLFIGCIFTTLHSFREIPLDILQSTTTTQLMKIQEGNDQESSVLKDSGTNTQSTAYGSTQNPELPSSNGQAQTIHCEVPVAEIDSLANTAVTRATLKEYLLSIIYMPSCLRMLCLTNLFCWMSLVCYSLYFTDFVAEAVFGGDPTARYGPLKEKYDAGVRFGCWGMALYSLSCSAYSFIIERLVKRFRARPVYICSQLVYSIGMVFMAALRHKVGVIIFSCSAGVMYSTLFTMPYLLVAHYHASGMFKPDPTLEEQREVRGLGTDVAIVSSMVFLAQFILSICMGSIIAAAGSTTAIMCSASFLAFCGALSATQILYLDI